jgi:hypothetical protein
MGWGIKRNLKPTRLRSLSFGAVHLAIQPCGKPQGILAKANKKTPTEVGGSGYAVTFNFIFFLPMDGTVSNVTNIPEKYLYF